VAKKITQYANRVNQFNRKRGRLTVEAIPPTKRKGKEHLKALSIGKHLSNSITNRARKGEKCERKKRPNRVLHTGRETQKPKVLNRKRRKEGTPEGAGDAQGKNMGDTRSTRQKPGGRLRKRKNAN